jgi:DNA polymerase-1
MVYGLDEEGLFYYLKAKGIKTSMKKVRLFHRAYFKKYAGVARFILAMRAFAVEHGYVETMFGFRRLVGSDADEDRQTNPENQAVNSPIQGSAHTLLLAAMALLSHRPKRYHLLQAPLMEVHDALVFRVKLRDLPQAYAMAKQLLEKDAVAYIKRLFGIDLQVPLLSEGSAGFQYGTMVELEDPSIHRFLAAWGKKYAEVDQKISAEYRKAA